MPIRRSRSKERRSTSRDNSRGDSSERRFSPLANIEDLKDEESELVIDSD